MSLDSTIHAKAIELIKLNYEMTSAAGSGHPTSGASLGHLVTALMYAHMRYEPSNPSHPGSDRLVLSEGHAVPIVYAACADKGVMIGKDKESWRAMTRADALTLRQLDSVVDGHPNPVEGFPFFDAATGSLGQGLSVAAGLAIAARADQLDKRIFVLIGDGESREGQIWEAVDFLKDHDLKAVCPIFNCNVYAQSDKVSPQQGWETTEKKLAAVGYEVLVIDGHDPKQIMDALNRHAEVQASGVGEPVAIVAKTVKGWGAESQQGNGHHGSAVKAGEALEAVLAEYDEKGKALGAYALGGLRVPDMSPRKSVKRETGDSVGFDKALEQFGMGDVIEKGQIATRKAYGVAVKALGHVNTEVFSLDCDVQGSTFASMFAKDESINSRFVECRIAEQNMMSVAAGLSAGGKIPFASTFAKFAARGYDQIEMAVNSGANLKVVGSHAGITLGADGPSQMGMSDVGWFRTFTTMKRPNGEPGFYVLTPSDGYQCYSLVREMAKYDGPCYLRTLRSDTEFLYSDDDEFKLGGHEVLCKGKDLLICASGHMVHVASAALEQLYDEGVDVTLVDMYSLPFDGDAILDLANECEGRILTLEDNYGGGMGSAVADVIAADGGGFEVNQMYVKKCPKSALSGEETLRACGLGIEDVVREAKEMLGIS
ncbi:Transketolase 1 [Poriferisphaera corsica]|uniref:Transketolase 1 n=1 Tax=Poriferisphaera corsica TaxID=2528020 RepID=A0A517YTE6_9BACT|nr:transketolase [Poriferisphaera corsica]QDU33510.1 Transketolase 1 [Poriferisphaera corsica]